MILVIDNYDSFVYNLVQYLGELGQELVVYRNDKIDVAKAGDISPKKIVVSPGPGRPEDAGASNELIKRFSGKIPILGVCLGHQCMAQVFGAQIVGASRIMHGKTSLVRHNSTTIFQGIPNPFEATRYHSLIVERATLPECLEITAQTQQKEIMGLKHKEYPVWGVQFHPESILTEPGKQILSNFLKL